jgi:hypothetical protein
MVDRPIAGEGVDLAGAGGRWPPIDQPPSRVLMAAAAAGIAG